MLIFKETYFVVSTFLFQYIQELQSEKKADDDVNINEEWNDSVSDTRLDEEAPLISSSRISHLGRKPA